MKSPSLRTSRLLLRRWTDADLDDFAQINADPEVMRFRYRPLSRDESFDLLQGIETCFDEHGFGQWAVERLENRRVIGFIGFDVAEDESLFSPPVHIGWHLTPAAWGCGYATEGAAAALDYVFDVVGLSQVVSHTTSVNERSQTVMRRLGMRHSVKDDFDGPWYPKEHPHRRFVLYRITADEWRRRRQR